MGYTHYLYREAVLPEAEFAAAVADCQKVCESLGIPLGDWEGNGEPTFEPHDIRFNGSVHSESFARDGGGLVWPESKAEGAAVIGQETKTARTWCGGNYATSRAVDEDGDGSYETFGVPRVHEPHDYESPTAGGLYCSSCKTNYRPYDLCVQCCLIVLKEHLGGRIRVRSDGDSEQWNEARDACQVFLGYGLTFDLDENAD